MLEKVKCWYKRSFPSPTPLLSGRSLALPQLVIFFYYDIYIPANYPSTAWLVKLMHTNIISCLQMFKFEHRITSVISWFSIYTSMVSTEMYQLCVMKDIALYLAKLSSLLQLHKICLCKWDLFNNRKLNTWNINHTFCIYWPWTFMIIKLSDEQEHSLLQSLKI